MRQILNDIANRAAEISTAVTKKEEDAKLHTDTPPKQARNRLEDLDRNLSTHIATLVRDLSSAGGLARTADGVDDKALKKQMELMRDNALGQLLTGILSLASYRPTIQDLLKLLGEVADFERKDAIEVSRLREDIRELKNDLHFKDREIARLKLPSFNLRAFLRRMNNNPKIGSKIRREIKGHIAEIDRTYNLCVQKPTTTSS